MEQLQDKLKAWIENPRRDHSEGVSLLSHLTNNRMLIRNMMRSESKYKREKLLYELQKHYKLLPPITTPIHIGHVTDPDTGTGSADAAIIPPVDPAGGELANELTNETAEGSALPPADPYNEIISDVQKIDTGVQNIDTTVPPVENIDHAKNAESLEISLTKMYNKKGILVNSLRNFKEEDNDGRKAVLEQISALTRDMESVKSKIDYFKLHGVLPEQDPLVPPADSKKVVTIPDDPILMKQMLLNERSNLSKIRKKLSEGNVNPDKIATLEQLVTTKTELVNEIQRRLDGVGS